MKWFAAMTLLFCWTHGASARAAAPADGARAHRILLPDARPLDGGQWADVDALAGQPPGPAHPAGTVIVAQASAQEPSPTVTEWDLASGSVVRGAALPLPASQADLRIVRAGGALHVFASRAPRGPIVYARLDESLRIERVEPLGFGERPRVATDGNVIAALWEGTAAAGSRDPGWRLILVDARGHPLWTARLARTDLSTYYFGNPLALVAGHVFALLPDRPELSIVEFSADGREQHVSALPYDSDDGRLFVTAGGLFFTDGCTATPLWSQDGSSTGVSAPLPGRVARSDRGRSCPAFEAVSDERGWLVTASGDVRAPSMALEAHFADPGDGAERRPLWVFGIAALLVIEREHGHVRLDWTDARP